MALPMGKGDIVHVHNAVDAMLIAAPSSKLRRRAALTVCAAMARSGDHPRSIRTILEMLDLIVLEDPKLEV